MISKILALISFSVAMASAGAVDVFPIGAKITNIEIVLANGQPIKFDAVPKQVTVLVMGASWCPPCGPMKADMQGSYAAEKITKAPNLRFVYVGVDSVFTESARSPASATATYNEAYVDVEKIKANGVTVRPGGNKFWVAGAYFYQYVPFTIVVDDKGLVLGHGLSSASLRRMTEYAATYAMKQ